MLANLSRLPQYISWSTQPGIKAWSLIWSLDSLLYSFSITHSPLARNISHFSLAFPTHVKDCHSYFDENTVNRNIRMNSDSMTFHFLKTSLVIVTTMPLSLIQLCNQIVLTPFLTINFLKTTGH